MLLFHEVKNTFEYNVLFMWIHCAQVTQFPYIWWIDGGKIDILLPALSTAAISEMG